MGQVASSRRELVSVVGEDGPIVARHEGIDAFLFTPNLPVQFTNVMSRWPSAVVVAPPDGAPGDIRVKFNATQPHVSWSMALAFIVDLFTKNGYTYTPVTTGGKFGFLCLVFTKVQHQYLLPQVTQVSQIIPQTQLQQVTPTPGFTQNSGIQLQPMYPGQTPTHYVGSIAQ